MNQFNVTLSNSGVRAASYCLVLNSVNVIFPSQNPQDYVCVNDTAIKIPFSFKELREATESKSVLFEIDNSVEGFMFKADVEGLNGDWFIVVTCVYEARCNYNSTLNSYVLGELTTVTA